MGPVDRRASPVDDDCTRVHARDVLARSTVAPRALQARQPARVDTQGRAALTRRCQFPGCHREGCRCGYPAANRVHRRRIHGRGHGTGLRTGRCRVRVEHLRVAVDKAGSQRVLERGRGRDRRGLESRGDGVFGRRFPVRQAPHSPRGAGGDRRSGGPEPSPPGLGRRGGSRRVHREDAPQGDGEEEQEGHEGNASDRHRPRRRDGRHG